ncbi:mannitol 2-dehydrogenase [Roseinatronobacter thiooxidans]|uniref:Mannitol 2-dehydrogenase n=1 Tax=Roseinatronobacter thiooxidans TaxID=121821 RepID=A0A2W7QHG4_9RHOB|nr:mannitol dehydrogenase family protein [Roseinatronobacter thiooxidans]PZX40659.1 mannitol 2-dehydrogenase [Roseinatronobacter thiooxidans]
MDELIPLSQATLHQLPETVRRPAYDRASLSPGIVHIGLGNFHRAHQAWYLHRLMNEGLAQDWAIIGAGIRPNDAAMRAKLLGQDCLTTLIELGPDRISAEIVGAMIDFVAVEAGNAALIACMAQPAIRIVSLTVTEGGYFIDSATKAFDRCHPDIVHDAAHPDTPRTAFGAIVAALRLRRARGLRPFTCMSCDNLQSNGAILRQAVVTLARLSDPELADWIAAECSFPNAMVDCIVPATGPDEIALAQGFGIRDAAPVTHEAFRQWVIEDKFCAGRPDWARVGVQFTQDVHGYEAQKLRILNAGHQVIGNVAEIMGIGTVAQAMSHPQINALFRKVQRTEIVPQVVPVPGMTPAQYVDLIAQRFANPAIHDTIRRVAFDGSSRHPGFVLPSLRDALASGTPIEGLALAQAFWARMCAGTREDGSTIAPNDPQWSMLTQVAHQARSRPAAWLEQTQIYGDLGAQSVFRDSFTRWLQLIWAQGSGAALRAYTGI